MHGKAVKIRHCPATVSGTKQLSVRHCIAKRMWEGERDTAPQSQETGSAETWELFSEGEKIMSLSASCSFCFCLRPNVSKASLKIQPAPQSRVQKSKYRVRPSFGKPLPIATDGSSSTRHCRAIIRF